MDTKTNGGGDKSRRLASRLLLFLTIFEYICIVNKRHSIYAFYKKTRHGLL